MKRKEFSDPLFLDQLVARDKNAVDKVVREYVGHILKAARGAGFNETDADEVTGRVFEKFYAALPKFRKESHVRTFLFGIFYRTVFEERRNLFKFNDYEAIDDEMEDYFDSTGSWRSDRDPGNPEEFLCTVQNLGIIEACMEKLPYMQKTVFIRKAVEEEGTEEICNELGISVTNVRQLFFRARAKLMKCILSHSKE